MKQLIVWKIHIYICSWLEDFLVEPMCRRIEQTSPTMLSMVSSHFSYALKPVKTRAVPVVYMGNSSQSVVFMLLVLRYLREVWRFSIPILKAACDDIELRMLTTNRDNATWHKQGNDNDIFRKICQESLCLPQDLECELWSMYWRTLFKCTRQKAGLSMPWKTVANHFLCKEILEHRLKSSKTSWWNGLHDGPPPLWCENLRPQVSQPCGQICKVIIKYSKLEQLTKCYCEQPKWWFSSTKEKG